MEILLLIAILIVLVGIFERLNATPSQEQGNVGLAAAKRAWIAHYLNECSTCARGQPGCVLGEELHATVERLR